jgi:hypothetical protein
VCAGTAWGELFQEHPVVLSPVCCDRPWVVGEDIARVGEIAMVMRIPTAVEAEQLAAGAVLLRDVADDGGELVRA